MFFSLALLLLSTDEISPKLMERIEKARQFRSLFHLERYVKLKTPDSYAIKEVTAAIQSDSFFFVIDRSSKQLLQFDENGEFVRAIGANGQGPEEYSGPRYLRKIHGSQFAMIDRSSILIYNDEGTFIKKIRTMQEYKTSPGNIIWNDPNRLFISGGLAPQHGKEHALVTLILVIKKDIMLGLFLNK